MEPGRPLKEHVYDTCHVSMHQPEPRAWPSQINAFLPMIRSCVDLPVQGYGRWARWGEEDGRITISHSDKMFGHVGFRLTAVFPVPTAVHLRTPELSIILHALSIFDFAARQLAARPI